jgi:hypothetical protein
MSAYVSLSMLDDSVHGSSCTNQWLTMYQNPDDNRHDLRPFLYVIDWPWQFNKIRNHASVLTEKLAQSRGQTA